MACLSKRETVTLFGVIFPAMAKPPNPRSKWCMEYATGKTDPWDCRITDGELRVKRLVQKTEYRRVGGSSKLARLTSRRKGYRGARAKSLFVIVKLVNGRSNLRCRNQSAPARSKQKPGARGRWAAFNEGRARTMDDAAAVLKEYRQNKESEFAKSVAKGGIGT